MDGFSDLITSSIPHLEEAARLLLACVLGGIIGYEREYTNRPAGFRTHILVCAGSALVMMTGGYLFGEYGAHTDPARLGAQVVSGIGFLGAGTIIRDGFNVRGLTTAASLWAVSCVGLAAGSGYYWGATVTAGLICATLTFLKKIDLNRWSANRYRVITVIGRDPSSLLCGSDEVFRRFGIQVKSVEFSEAGDGRGVAAKFSVKMPNFDIPGLAGEIKNVEGVGEVRIEQ